MASVSAILTAAGESTRMGRPKPLLPWHGATLVEYQITNLLGAGVAEIVVVLGHEHETVAPFVTGRNVHSVVNNDYRQGKTTSIKTGLRSVAPTATDVLLLAVDQPRPAEIIRAVIEAHLQVDALVTSPRHRGHGGHPLVFSARLKGELEAISEERQGIREVFETHRGEVHEVTIDDPIVRLDLNTPEMYEEAKARLEQRDRDRETQIAELREAIQERLDSGPADPLDIEAMEAEGRRLLAQRSARSENRGKV